MVKETLMFQRPLKTQVAHYARSWNTNTKGAWDNSPRTRDGREVVGGQQYNHKTSPTENKHNFL